MSASTATASALREVGLRATAPRIAVLEALGAVGGHPDAETIAAAVRERLGTVSTQTVYDVLHALSAVGLIRRLEAPGSTAARFELDMDDNHHHLSCIDCQRIVDVPCQHGSAPCLDLGDDHGFEITEVTVVFRGRCPDCRANAAAS